MTRARSDFSSIVALGALLGRRAAGPALTIACLAMLAVLAVLWRHDRAHPWERPRLDDAGFVQLSGAAPSRPFTERWLVIVQHRCPHCREHLARAVAERAHRTGIRLDALFVDTGTPPVAAAFTSPGVDGWWWDARDTWRRRWGHRLYGEVLVFDRAGRYRRTWPPSAVAAHH